MIYTLAQFEKIDGLFNACLHRPDIEQVMAHPLASRDYVRNVYFRPEWELEAACVDVMGLEAVQAFPSAVDAAADFLTRCLSSATLVEAA
jgi:hypothetical protein